MGGWMENSVKGRESTRFIFQSDILQHIYEQLFCRQAPISIISWGILWRPSRGWQRESIPGERWRGTERPCPWKEEMFLPNLLIWLRWLLFDNVEPLEGDQGLPYWTSPVATPDQDEDGDDAVKIFTCGRGGTQRQRQRGWWRGNGSESNRWARWSRSQPGIIFCIYL